MTKRRIITIIISLLLCGCTVFLHIVWKKHMIEINPVFMEWMLVSTAILVFFGCMLQSFGHPKLAVLLSDFIFVTLCVCMYYSKSAIEILVFMGCMFIVLRRASTACECVRGQSCNTDQNTI